MPELPAAHLPLGSPGVMPEATTPPQAWGTTAAAPTDPPAATDDWLHGVRACNLIDRVAELGTCPLGAPLKATAGGAVRLNLNLKGLGSIKIAQLTKGNTHTHTQTGCTVARAQG